MITSTTPVTPSGLIDRIREAVQACGSNKNDRAIVAIKICILEGVDTKRHIVSCLMQAGLENSHAGAIIDTRQGPSPTAHEWRLGQDGRYRLHESVGA